MNDLQTSNAPPSQMYWELKIPPFDDLLQSVIQFEVDKDKPQHIPFLSFSLFWVSVKEIGEGQGWGSVDLHRILKIECTILIGFSKRKRKRWSLNWVIKFTCQLYLPVLGVYTFFWQGNKFLLRLRYLNNSLWSQFTAISTLSLPHVISYPEIQVSQFSSKITLIQICCCR